MSPKTKSPSPELKDSASQIDKTFPAKGYRFLYQRGDNQAALKAEVHAHFSKADKKYIICDKGQVEFWSASDSAHKKEHKGKAYPSVNGFRLKEVDSLQINITVGGWQLFTFFEVDENGQPLQQTINAKSSSAFCRHEDGDVASVKLETFDCKCDSKALEQDPDYFDSDVLPTQKVKIAKTMQELQLPF